MDKEYLEALAQAQHNERTIAKGRLNILREKILLETSEARICLDRDNPNIPMALNRLRDIVNILESAAG